MNDELPALDVEGLLTEARRIRDSISTENDRRRWQDIRRNLAIGLALLIAAVGVGSGLSGRSDAHAAQVALDHYIASSADARIAGCDQYNVQRDAQVAAEKKEERSRVFQSNAAVANLLQLLHLSTADLLKIQRAHLRSFDKTVEQAHVKRDCTEAGIARYLEGPTTTKAAP